MSDLPDILYHYCSTEAFYSIVTSHSIRLSALSLSNDSMEGNMAREALVRLAKRDKLDADTILLLQQQFDVYRKKFDGFGFCLSKHKDQLSQWRGYAADGVGVAIGFSREYLESLLKEYSQAKWPFLGFTIQEVLYDPKQHELLVQSLYEQLKEAIHDGVLLEAKEHSFILSRSNDPETQEIKSRLANIGFSTLLAAHTLAFVLKSLAFKEESEFRLLTVINQGEIKNIECRPKSDRLIPYRKYELKKFAQTTPEIKEVILGPKHRTPVSMVEDFLRSNEYGYVRVECSDAPYC
jgi:hypothetical protein